MSLSECYGKFVPPAGLGHSILMRVDDSERARKIKDRKMDPLKGTLSSRCSAHRKMQRSVNKCPIDGLCVGIEGQLGVCVTRTCESRAVRSHRVVEIFLYFLGCKYIAPLRRTYIIYAALITLVANMLDN